MGWKDNIYVKAFGKIIYVKAFAHIYCSRCVSFGDRKFHVSFCKVMFILDHFSINIKWNNLLHVQKNIEVYICLPIELMKAIIQTYILYI